MVIRSVSYKYYLCHTKIERILIFSVGMPEPRATILVRVSANLKSRLLEIAKRERRSLSKQVELILEQCVESDSEHGPTPLSQKGQRRKP
jgi:hypothetical protein